MTTIKIEINPEDISLDINDKRKVKKILIFLESATRKTTDQMMSGFDNREFFYNKKMNDFMLSVVNVLQDIV